MPEALFLGGIFSLDGLHPSQTGHAIIANYFIETLNGTFHLNLPLVSVEAIAAEDPLYPHP